MIVANCLPYMIKLVDSRKQVPTSRSDVHCRTLPPETHRQISFTVLLQV